MAESTEVTLLAKLEEWLAAQGGMPTGHDIIQAGDFDLLAGFVLSVVGSAALSAPVSRLRRQPDTGLADVRPANPAMRVFAGLARAWSLSPEEEMALLDADSTAEMRRLELMPKKEVPIVIVERLIILLDIFKAINTLLPAHAQADGWIRKSNPAPIFGRRAPLLIMMEGLEGMRRVRQHLQAEIWS